MLINSSISLQDTVSDDYETSKVKYHAGSMCVRERERESGPVVGVLVQQRVNREVKTGKNKILGKCEIKKNSHLKGIEDLSTFVDDISDRHDHLAFFFTIPTHISEIIFKIMTQSVFSNMKDLCLLQGYDMIVHIIEERSHFGKTRTNVNQFSSFEFRLVESISLEETET